MDDINKILSREDQTGVSLEKELGKGALPQYKKLFTRLKSRRRANAAKHLRRVIWKPDWNYIHNKRRYSGYTQQQYTRLFPKGSFFHNL